jgi:hypothetical protein
MRLAAELDTAEIIYGRFLAGFWSAKTLARD